MIEALARAMAARDGLTHEHARRVQRYALALAGEVSIGDERTLGAIDAAALLHDIGKLGIPDRLLEKPGPLTPPEYDHVKRHSIIGADILSAVAFPGPLAIIVRHHHENWDGTGYPDGLSGEAIPIGARVLAIVDCYDALTSDRPYRRALSRDCAVAMIHERRGTMYDPAIVQAFLRIVQCADGAFAPEDVARPRTRADASWWKARAI
jgi:putative nucleotidyltransferase with HDIG domain